MPKKVTQSLTSVGTYMRPGGQGLVVWSLGDHTLKSHTLTVHAPHPPSWLQTVGAPHNASKSTLEISQLQAR